MTVGSSLQIDSNESASIEVTYVQTSLATDQITSSPVDGVVTRWRIRGYTAEVSPAEIRFRVLRPAGGDAFTALSSTSELLPTTPGIYEFPARVAIQNGDYIGLTLPPVLTVFFGCSPCPGAGAWEGFAGPFADNETRTATPNNDELVAINADVEPDADHDGFGDDTQDECPVTPATQGLCSISLGRLKKNKKNGTALLPIRVPGAGTLALGGRGIVQQRVPANRRVARSAGRAVAGAGTVNLLIKPKGKVRHKLNRRGKVKVKAQVTYTPTGGPAVTQSRPITLVKTH